MATQYERREQLIQEMSKGKGYAFLTSGQKSQIDDLISKEFPTGGSTTNNQSSTNTNTKTNQTNTNNQNTNTSYNPDYNAQEAARIAAEKAEAERQKKIADYTSTAKTFIESGASNDALSNFASKIPSDIYNDVFKNVPGLSTNQATVTVQSGDTLSAIASKYGVGVNDISGYRSGDPNLIYPGEVLTIKRSGSGAGATKTAGTTTGGYNQTSNPQDEINGLNDVGNNDQNTDLSNIKNTLGNNIDVSDSKKLAQALIDSFANRSEEPTKTREQVYTEQRAQLGVGGLEDELAGLDNEIRKLDDAYKSTIGNEENRRVSMLKIRARESDVDTRYKRERSDLETKRADVANRLNQKYGVLNTMVNLIGMDIDTAQQKYQNDFSNALSLVNLVSGIEERDKNDAERKADNARANLTVMYNSIKDGNVSYDDLDTTTKLDIRNMEIQAGLPSGFVQFIQANVDSSNSVKILGQYTDENSDRIQPIMVTRPNGSYSFESIPLGKTNTDSTTFSDTQINKGASSIGVSINMFRSFSEDTKNTIINNKDFTDLFSLDLADIKDGTQTKQEVIDNLNSQENMPESIRNDLINVINNITSPTIEPKEQSVWGRLWGNFTNNLGALKNWD